MTEETESNECSDPTQTLTVNLKLLYVILKKCY